VQRSQTNDTVPIKVNSNASNLSISELSAATNYKGSNPVPEDVFRSIILGEYIWPLNTCNSFEISQVL